MIRITIGNSYSQITGLSPTEEKALRLALSYVVGGSSAHFSGFRVKRRSLLDKKGFFPTGLLYRVLKLYSNISIADNRVIPKKQNLFKLKSTGLTPYTEQLEAIDAVTSTATGGVVMPTGSGKSITMALLVNKMQVRTLIIVPTLALKYQLTETFEGLFGVNKNIVIENIDSSNLSNLTNFDMLILDECHKSASSTYQKLNKAAWTGIYYRYFFSATYFRNDPEEQVLFEAIAGVPAYSLPINTAIKNNLIVGIESYYIESPQQDTNAHSWAQVYKELVVNNAPRNVLICGLIARLFSAQKSTLCLVKEIAHGKVLSEMTGLPFISGEDSESKKYIRQFADKKLMAVIATTGVMGTGVDSKACEYVIIAGLGKAKSQFMQQVGRAVRTYPGKESAKVILVKDRSHKFTLRHFNAQCKILKEEYNTKSLKLEI